MIFQQHARWLSAGAIGCLMILAAGSVAADEAVVRGLHATCKFVNSSSSATGFLVTRSDPANKATNQLWLITAAHVLEKSSGPEAKLIGRRAQGEQGWQRQELTIRLRDGEQRLWLKHPTADAAALRVDLPADFAAGAIGWERLAGDAEFERRQLGAGDEIFIAGYPVQVEVNAFGFPVARRGIFASFPLKPAAEIKTFVVDANTFSGDSGSPVFARDTAAANGKAPSLPLIVGLVSGYHQQDERINTAYEERVLHHRLGLAIIVPAELIRQTVEKDVPAGAKP